MLRGLTETGNVYRLGSPSVDAVGGAQTPAETLQFAAVLCRISTSGSFRRVENMEGIDVRKLIKVLVAPAIDVRTNDIFIPASGFHLNKRFVVVDVQIDSIEQDSKMSHVEFTAERIDYARSKQ